jgi:hypothetical protein
MSRKLRILLFEVVCLGLLIAWFMWKYPELIDGVIPWIALLVAWHLTWEYILSTERLRRVATACRRKIRPLLAWPLAFLLGGGVSLLYWKGINSGIRDLAEIAADRTAEKRGVTVAPIPPIQESKPEAKSEAPPGTAPNDGRTNTGPSKPELPDLGLKFVTPEDVAFEIVNLSGQVVRNPKYWFYLVDLDGPRTVQIQGEAVPQILPIPAETISDFLRPHDNYLPLAIVSSFPAVRAIVKPGHRVVGLAEVTCPDCAYVRKYWLFFIYGSGGWYCETPKEEESPPFPIVPLVIRTEETINNLAPPEKRVPIGNRY